MQKNYPWHETTWQQLTALQNNAKLPHALLLSGQEGLGKTELAKNFAQWLHCTASSQIPCNQCQSCLWHRTAAHPECLTIEPIDNKANITIDQVRETLAFAQLTPQYSTTKTILIKAADTLNKAAKNALLKILEEPPENTHFILVTSNKHLLSATIISRLVEFNLKTPDKQIAINWLNQQGVVENQSTLLALAKGAPLKAKQLAMSEALRMRQEYHQDLIALAKGTANPIQIAEKWAKTDVQQGLYLLYSWISDLTYLALGQNVAKIENLDNMDTLKILAKRFNARALLGLLSKIEQQLAERVILLGKNKQLCFESLLIEWAELTRT